MPIFIIQQSFYAQRLKICMLAEVYKTFIQFNIEKYAHAEDLMNLSFMLTL